MRSVPVVSKTGGTDLVVSKTGGTDLVVQLMVDKNAMQ
jgi:hypothetical protein